MRGLDVFELLPSEYLSENEIAAAVAANRRGGFNPQQQFSIDWPAEPVVARAYLDQLERGDKLSTSFVADLAAALDHAASILSDGTHDEELATSIDSMAATLEQVDGDAITKKRQSALAETLGAITARLR